MRKNPSFYAFYFNLYIEIDIIKEEEVTASNETVEEMNARGKLYLESSNNNLLVLFS